MAKNEINIGQKTCTIYEVENPEYILIQPVDEFDLKVLDHQVELMREAVDKPFLLVAITIEHWHDELTPWSAPAVFGKEGFGDQAKETLAYIETVLLPELTKKYQIKDTMPIILGGYSLAGLFSIWSACQSKRFSAIAAISPSLWYPDWITYVKEHVPATKAIYLSLGDREDKTKNPVMATAGQRIREQQAILKEQGIACTLEWNAGHHFQDTEVRCAKGFSWCMQSMREVGGL